MGLEKNTFLNDPFNQFSCGNNFRCCSEGLVQLEANPVITATDCVDCSRGQKCPHMQGQLETCTCACPIRASVFGEWTRRAVLVG